MSKQIYTVATGDNILVDAVVANDINVPFAVKRVIVQILLVQGNAIAREDDESDLGLFRCSLLPGQELILTSPSVKNFSPPYEYIYNPPRAINETVDLVLTKPDLTGETYAQELSIICHYTFESE